MVARNTSPAAVAAVVEIIRREQLKSAHYWGNADRDIILALKQELGLQNFGVSDVFDRWYRSLRFWGGDGCDISGPEYASPEWLRGVRVFQEGIHRTNFIIFDWLPSYEWRDHDLTSFLARLETTCIAIIGMPPDEIPEAKEFCWIRQQTVVVGKRRLAIRRSIAIYRDRYFFKP